MNTNCLIVGLDYEREMTISCSADAGHGGEHYYTGAGGKNLCYWDELGNIRWVNR